MVAYMQHIHILYMDIYKFYYGYFIYIVNMYLKTVYPYMIVIYDHSTHDIATCM